MPSTTTMGRSQGHFCAFCRLQRLHTFVTTASEQDTKVTDVVFDCLPDTTPGLSEKATPPHASDGSSCLLALLSAWQLCNSCSKNLLQLKPFELHSLRAVLCLYLVERMTLRKAAVHWDTGTPSRALHSLTCNISCDGILSFGLAVFLRLSRFLFLCFTPTKHFRVSSDSA